jgi:AraC-like DNA-binding protein
MARSRNGWFAGFLNKLLSNDHRKFALFCFSIAALPVIIIGIFSYIKSSSIVLENVSKEKVLNMRQLEANIEQLLVTVERSSSHFLRSSSIRAAYYEPLSPGQFDLFNTIKEELNHLQTLDSGISDIIMYSKEGNWIINNTGLNRLNEWPGAVPYLKLAEKSMTSEWKVVPAVPGSTDTGCESTVQYVRKLPVSAFEQTGLFVVNIPSCNLEKLFALNQDKEFAAILDQNKQVIASDGSLTAGLINGLRQAISTEVEQNASGYKKVTLDGTEYSIAYSRSIYNNWVYVSVITLKELTWQSKEIGWFTFLVCLILLVLFLFISWSGSKRLYLPILNLYQFVSNHSSDQPAEKRTGELRYIGEQLHRLVYTKSELESKLHSHLEQSRILFMVRLFQGYLKGEEITPHLETFGLQHKPAHGALAVIALQIKGLDHTRFEEKDRDLLMFAVNNIVGELIPQEKRLYPILLGQAQVTLVMAESAEPEAFTEEMNGIVRRVAAAADQYLNLPVRIGISSPFREWSHAPRAFEEGMEALHHGIRNQEEAVIYFRDLGEDHGLHYAFPQEIEAMLLDAIKQGDDEAARQHLNEIIGSAFISTVSSGTAQGAAEPFIMIRLLIDLLGLMQSLGIKSDLGDGLEQSLFDQLFRLKSSNEAAEWFDVTMIQPLLSHIRDRTESRHQQLTQHMLQMVQEQFGTDLTIDSCAKQLHYNANYLNTIFRREMNMPFGAYLAQYRHQTALKWLVETNMSVKEISERLCYNNSQNFIRSFRKTEGITPGEYKKQYGGRSE